MKLKKILLGSLAVVPLIFSGQSMAAVLGGVHDMSTGSSGSAVTGTTADDDQVCVFCHTPHDSATTALQVIPLWNRTTTATVFTGATKYADNGSGTLSGTPLDLSIAAGGGVSLACLSCHDGTQAMSALINIPGSGDSWAVATYQDNATATGSMNTGTGILQGVVNLGTDLSNDHPIGIQYGGGGCTSAADCAAGALTDTAMKGAYLSGTQHWVDVDGLLSYSAADVIPLFDRDFGGTDMPSVECASCHDVHAATANSQIAGQMLLRVSSADSAICTSCHVK